jgi:hypothetical protein
MPGACYFQALGHGHGAAGALIHQQQGSLAGKALSVDQFRVDLLRYPNRAEQLLQPG